MSDITLSKAVRANLLSLQNTADLMSKTQERLATGKKVNSALDNPSNFFTASALNARAGDLNALMDNMANGIKTIEAADNGLTAITKNLESMQSTLRQARQDKSFQVATFDVTQDSIINIAGGTLADAISVRLADPDPGVRATLTSTAAYAGPDTTGTTQGGAQSVVAYNATMDNSTAITVNGVGINLAGVTGLNNVANKIGTDLGANYSVSVQGTDIVIENIDSTLAPPVVDLGGTAATPSVASFAYDPARMGGTIDIGGTTYTVPGGPIEDFVTSLGAQLGSAYEVSAQGNEVTILATNPGATPINVNGLPPATQATTTFDITDAQALITAGSITVGSASIDLSTLDFANPTLATPEDDIAAAIEADLGAGWTVTNAGGTLTIQHTAGAQTAPNVSATAGIDAASVSRTDGLAAVNVNSATGNAGAVVSTNDAPADTFRLTYGSKHVDLKITAGTEEQMTARLNNQLEIAGIKVKASFTNGELSFIADEPEAKTLAISQGSATDIFGQETVAIGVDDVPPLNATKAVDKFVELINGQYATSVRASNDNGRLRIENLSTSEMSLVVDKTGNGATSDLKIGGNAVRSSLAREFNDLKNQLDRLSDDASFNGINLLRGDNLRITFNESGNSFIEIQTTTGDGLNAATLKLRDLDPSELDADGSIDALLAEVKLSLNAVRTQASKFGSNLSIVQNRQDFTKRMINTLETGAANLTLADMNEEAANLLALQTRQSLSSSSLSLASQADQSVLQLLQ
jgi:flagellin